MNHLQEWVWNLPFPPLPLMCIGTKPSLTHLNCINHLDSLQFFRSSSILDFESLIFTPMEFPLSCFFGLPLIVVWALSSPHPHDHPGAPPKLFPVVSLRVSPSKPYFVYMRILTLYYYCYFIGFVISMNNISSKWGWMSASEKGARVSLASFFVACLMPTLHSKAQHMAVKDWNVQILMSGLLKKETLFTNA